MALRRTITVSITEEQDALLRGCLQSGRYGSVSEIVRAALRLLDREEAPALASVRTRKAEHNVPCDR